MTDFAVLRQRMVDNQLRPSEVTDPNIVRAFLTLPRESFVAPSERPFAYADRPLLMAEAAPARRMMEPVQLARLLQALPLGPQAKAMVVGCGSGYSAAAMAQLAGKVVAVEEDPALAAMARRMLAEVGAANVSVVEGKLRDGAPAEAPFDAILVDGAVEEVPDSLVAQLKPFGTLTGIERGERISRAVLYERLDSDASRRPMFEAWAALLPGFERPHVFVF